jgi:hypothetical protein
VTTCKLVFGWVESRWGVYELLGSNDFSHQPELIGKDRLV